MPFTLFHAGAGLLGKGIAPRRQSLIFFMACQVAIDLEPGIKMLADYQGDLHTVTHSPLGLFVTTAACAAAWYFAQRTSWWPIMRLPSLDNRTLIDTAFWSAITHLLLDAASHRDMYGSELLFAGIDYAEDAALLIGALGLLLLGARWLVGIVATRQLIRRSGERRQLIAASVPQRSEPQSAAPPDP